MDNKVSFLMYNEWGEMFEMISIKEQGMLISAIFKYQNTGEIPEFDGQLKMAFSIMQKQFDRDSKKWDKIRQQRSESGKKGAEVRWNKEESSDKIRQMLGME